MRNASLTRTLLDAHRADSGGLEWATGEPVDIRPDHVVAGGVAAVVALAGYECLGLPRIVPEVAVVGAERHDTAAAFEAGAELRHLQERAARSGAVFVRPGDGRCEIVHLERLAAPGRVLVSTGRRSPLAGALGMPVLPCGALEAAAALAGRPRELRWSGVLGIGLEGRAASWQDGHDVLCGLLGALGPGGAGGRFLEFGGPGLSSIGARARVLVAREVERLGSPAALFPSDDVTRAFLAAHGRDADWRRFDTGDLSGCERVRTLSLTTLEPMTLALERGALPRPVRDDSGLTVGAVLIGSGAGAADLARLARVFENVRVPDSTALWVAPGSRRVSERAESDGALAVLRDAGARIVEGHMPPTLAALGLAYGALPSDLPGGRTQWRNAGLSTCAAAATCGFIDDPRERLPAGLPELPEAAALSIETRPAPATEAETRSVAAFPLGHPLDGPMRGAVIARLRDRVTSEEVLPWGARVRSLVNDFPALSEYAFGGVAPDFCARARATGGGFVVAGADFGVGEAWDTAALVLVGLGVRAILARSISPAFDRLLALAGILPLTWASGGEGSNVEPGDELEFPGTPETLIAGRPLVVRNLTRGTQYTLRHGLSDRDVTRLRRGGLLAEIAAR